MEDLRVFLEDNSGKMVFLLGAVSLGIAFASYNAFGTILTAVTLFLGITMMFIGISVQFGMFSGGLRSFGGFGMLLICVSVALFAMSLAAYQFLGIASWQVRQIFWDGRESIRRWGINIDYYRPYLWMSYLFVESGLGFLIAGIGTRIASLRRR